MMFSAYTPLAGGRADTYQYPAEYPYDLDAGLDYTRPATGVSLFPFPQVIGYVQGLCPQYDDLSRARSSVELNATVLNILNMSSEQQALVFPDLTGGLRKVTG
jgi:alpha-glucuronidase